MNPSTSQPRLLFLSTLVSAVILLSCTACDLPTRPRIQPVEQTEQPLRAAVSVDVGYATSLETSVAAAEFTEGSVIEGPVHPFRGNWESWDAYFRGGKPIGYRHVVAEAISDESGSDVRYRVQDQLAIERGKTTLIQRLSHTSTESATGRLLDFQGEFQVGPSLTRFEGTIDDGELVVDTIRATSRSKQRIPWQSTYRGLIAVQQSLHRKPIEQGETRTLKMLLPIRHQVATVRLDCNGMAAVPMIDGKHRQLLEINVRIELEGQVVGSSVMWTDETGTTLRSYTPALRMVAYRTDEAAATASNAAATDAVSPATIEVSGALLRSAEAVQVAYLISPVVPSNATDSITIDPAPGQVVRVRPDGVIQVLVSCKSEPSIEGFTSLELESTDGDRQPNTLIDFEAPLIVRIADAVTATRDLNDRQIATELARTVNSLINTREFTGAFSPASAVARDAVGDCTDQSVLLAAMLRARGIPSRLAAGLRYVPGDPAKMAYHMWTLGYVEGSWVALDATIGGLAPADRITLGTTNLSDGEDYDCIAAAMALMGQVELQVSGAEY